MKFHSAFKIGWDFYEDNLHLSSHDRNRRYTPTANQLPIIITQTIQISISVFSSTTTMT